jgi:hypothetical protein
VIVRRPAKPLSAVRWAAKVEKLSFESEKTMTETTDMAKKQFDMCVFFSIEKNNKKILEGSFIITSTNGISCIGENHKIEFGFTKDEMYTSGIFKGLIIDHVLVQEEESASISLTLLDVVKDEPSTLGVKQVVILQAGMNMGILSGSKTQDSIMIDPEHKFLYRTFLFRRKVG